MRTTQSKFVNYLLLLPGNTSHVTFSLQFRSFSSSSDLFLPFSAAFLISVHHLNSFHCLDSLHYLSDCLVFAERSSPMFDCTQPAIELVLLSWSPFSGHLDFFHHFDGSHVPDGALPMAALNLFVFLSFSAALTLPEPPVFIILCVPLSYIHPALKDTLCGLSSGNELHPLIAHSFYMLFSQSFSTMSLLILSLSPFSTILL